MHAWPLTPRPPPSSVGKLRKRWVQDTLSPVGVDTLRALKHELDPTNVFGSQNLLP